MAADLVDRLVFGRRRVTAAAFALATLAMAWSAATGLRVDAGFTKQLPVAHEYMRTFLEHRDDFGGADRVAVALAARGGDMFTPEFFALLRQVTDAVFFLPGVDRTQVYSPLTPNVRYIEVVEDRTGERRRPAGRLRADRGGAWRKSARTSSRRGSSGGWSPTTSPARW